MIYVLGMGAMAITGTLYLAYILYQLIKQLRHGRVERRKYEPTESIDKVEGEE
ncbi:MAG: hypothetical protein K0M69_15880 [Youngiibacter sp.]|nr:hypothetical protein [Youngiibacter sp.]